MSAVELHVRGHLPQLLVRLRGPRVQAFAGDIGAGIRWDGAHAPPAQVVLLVERALEAARSASARAAQIRSTFTAAQAEWVQGAAGARSEIVDQLAESLSLPRAIQRRGDLEAIREYALRIEHQARRDADLALIYAGRAASSLIRDPAIPTQLCFPFFERLHVDAALLHRMEAGDADAAAREAARALVGIYRGLRTRHALSWWPAQNTGRMLAFANAPERHPLTRAAVAGLAGMLPREASVEAVGQLLMVRAVDPRGFLVRAAVLDGLTRTWPPEQTVAMLADHVAARDPSEHVRIVLGAACGALAVHGGLRALGTLAGLDRAGSEPSARVRATAARALVAAIGAGTAMDAAAGLLQALITVEEAPLVFAAIGLAIDQVAVRAPGHLAVYAASLQGTLASRAVDPGLSAATHEILTAARERLAAIRDADQTHLLGWLATQLEPVRPGGRRRVPLPSGTTDGALARALAMLSRRDFGVYARRRGRSVVLWRGARRRRRLWRILHELRHPGPTKRVGVPHTIGRLMPGRIRAHAGLMDEVTATTVPGEPVHIAAEGGWGRHLPGVDDLLSLPRIGRPVICVASSQGVTTVRAPGGLRHLGARARLNWHYARWAARRLEALRAEEAHARGAYVAGLRALGYAIEFAPHDAEGPVPPSVASLFGDAGRPSSAAPIAAAGLVDPGALMDLLRELGTFVLSWAEGGQAALALFLGLALAGIFGIGTVRRARLRSARARVPLSIGGWGTRGKSGTERLKSGLFHGLGYDVFVKTTGCEAMLMHSVPGEAQREVYLFRPYDKASIWEQRDMIELAAALDAEVFLWECMALNPRYVGVLQHEWMADDYATLTNAYPDHEDVQGPAGEDVARVIGEFIPKGSNLITSETNFLPLFTELARHRGTRLRAVDPLEGELIAEDLLALFPYAEHPRNIALVMGLAEELGEDRHEALVLMAENVVPDLGVLKTYPEVRVRGRQLSFVNSMSANERAGFMNNWIRSGCDRLDPDADPARMVITVVNNRGDRIPRSGIFAHLLARDVSADGHVFIGTNLRGLMRYYHAALDEVLAGLEVVRSDDVDERKPAERLARWLGRVRLATPSFAAVADRLLIYLGGLDRAAERVDVASLQPVVEAWLARDDCPLDPEAARRAVAADPAWRDGLLALLASSRPAPAGVETVVPATEAEFCAAADRCLAGLVIAARLHRLVRGAEPIAARNDAVRACLRALLLDAVVVVEDPAATGDQIIDACARMLPPGAQATVMGIQNIKGTGLDFVYRWLALEKITDLLGQLDARDEQARIAALHALAAFPDPGVVGAGLARARLSGEARGIGGVEREAHDHAERVLAEQADALVAALGAGSGAGILARAAELVEGMLDWIDSPRRAWRARRIFRDLVRGRMGHLEAEQAMKALYDRGHGGWLLRLFRRGH